MRVFSPIFLLVASLSMTACSHPEAPTEPIRSVKLTQVAVSGVSARQELAGDVRAQVESRLGFRVGGKLIARPATVGQKVKTGDVLAQLDANDLALAAQAAKAQAAAAQSQRDVVAADLKRYTDLKAKGFVSGAEIERRQGALDAAEATLKQARAQLDVQGHQADYARLLADGPGVVVGVDAEVGQVVGAGTPVVRVARDGVRDVVVSVAESALAQLRVGLQAQVRLGTGGESAAPWVGTVREVAVSADPATRTYQVKFSLPAGAVAPLGATAYVTLPLPQDAVDQVIKLPTSALMKASGADKASTAVWVFDAASGTVSPRPVQVAGVDGNDAVIAAGLKPGEEVVSAGVHVLSPGQKVTRFAAAAQ